MFSVVVLLFVLCKCEESFSYLAVTHERDKGILESSLVSLSRHNVRMKRGREKITEGYTRRASAPLPLPTVMDETCPKRDTKQCLGVMNKKLREQDEAGSLFPGTLLFYPLICFWVLVSCSYM